MDKFQTEFLTFVFPNSYLSLDGGVVYTIIGAVDIYNCGWLDYCHPTSHMQRSEVHELGLVSFSRSVTIYIDDVK